MGSVYGTNIGTLDPNSCHYTVGAASSSSSMLCASSTTPFFMAGKATAASAPTNSNCYVNSCTASLAEQGPSRPYTWRPDFLALFSTENDGVRSETCVTVPYKAQRADSRNTSSWNGGTSGCACERQSSSYSTVSRRSSSYPSSSAQNYARLRSSRGGNACRNPSQRSATRSSPLTEADSSASSCASSYRGDATSKGASRSCSSRSPNTNSCYRSDGHLATAAVAWSKRPRHPFSSQYTTRTSSYRSHQRFSTHYEATTMKGYYRSSKIIYRPLCLFVAGAASYSRADRFSE